ncbi:hypothetical protein ACVXHA_12705 [Escherichia coli]
MLAAMCEPQIAIVSLTITERVFPLSGDRTVNARSPDGRCRRENPHQPKTATGVIVEALARRKAAGLPHLPSCNVTTCQKTVMLCVTLSLHTRKLLM